MFDCHKTFIWKVGQVCTSPSELYFSVHRENWFETNTMMKMWKLDLHRFGELLARSNEYPPVGPCSIKFVFFFFYFGSCDEAALKAVAHSCSTRLCIVIWKFL
jgi:hypothetical protein